MDARIIYLLITLFELAYNFSLNILQDKQRKLPLPIEVADIFTQERYQTYLNFVADSKRCDFVETVINLIINIVLIFSPFYAWSVQVCNGDVYLNVILYLCITTLLSVIVEYSFGYYRTFVIEEKYGKNKHTVHSFNKDFLITTIPMVLLSGGLMIAIVYVFEHLAQWTNNFAIDFQLLCIILCVLVLIFFALYCVLGSISLLILKKQYTFTPLAEGDLKTKIEHLLVGCKKKIRAINVYDESKKSTSKNAFLLKFLWIKEFGIADNFIDGNSEDELLAVLSHEIGHLKHKKHIWNYLLKFSFVIPLGFIVYLLYHVDQVHAFNTWILDSFHIQGMCYPVLFLIYGAIFNIGVAMITFLATYVTRMDEYEADRNAVENGYGEALIHTFKQLSSDELINVNPHPIVEFLEYDHPGMYQRIKSIYAYMEQLEQTIPNSKEEIV